MAGTPEISVGFPVYNGERFLRCALDSLLEQDHPSFEIVLSDNGSTDGTRAICEAYAKQDARIRFFANDENRGAVWNFNYVVEQSRGRYFMWAAHDDMWRKDCLSLYARALDASPDAVLVYCRAQPVGTQGQPIGEPYKGFANDAPTAHERFVHLLEHWEIHAAIYGLYRMDALRRTRLILVTRSCEIVFLAEIALQGKTIEIPDHCALKRIPDVGTSYRSRAEQYAYLDPRLKKEMGLSFLRLEVTGQSLRAALTSNLSLADRSVVAWSATRLYLRKWLSVDIKEAVIWQLADRHPGLLRTMRSTLRRIRGH